MGEVTRELRSALRRLARAPVFTVVSVLTLGVGIGAFAAIYGVVDSVLVEPPPYDEPDELVWIWRDYTWFDLSRGWLGGPDIAQLRAHDDVFESVIAFRNGGANLTGRDGATPRRVRVMLASAGFFEMLGVSPALGRSFRPEEDAPAAPAVAVLGYDLWRTQFGSDPDVVGTEIYLDGERTTVIGVAPESFHFVRHGSLVDPEGGDLYQPLRIDLASEDPGSGAFAGLARVRDGVAPDQIEAAISAVAADLDDLWGNPGLRMWSIRLREDLVAGVRSALSALLASAGFLLLILGANLATLLLGRATARDREIAVRSALGAGRGRLVHTVLSESALLGGAGAALGIALAFPTLRLLRAIAPADLPRLADIAIDPSVVLVAVVAALLMAIGAGLLPASRALRGDVSTRLRDRTDGAGSGLGGLRLRGALVVAQVALSLMLLLGAGLLTRGYLRLLSADPGFDGRDALSFTVSLDGDRYEPDGAIADFDRRFRSGLRGLPGVTAVGASEALPLTAGTNQSTATFPGAPGNTGVEEQDKPLLDYYYAGPGYAEAVGLRVIEGRAFDERDVPESPGVVLVDDVVASRYFPGTSAVGGRMAWRGDTLTIAGVIDQPRMYTVHADDRPQIVLPLLQRPFVSTLSYVVAGPQDPSDLAPSMRRVLDGVDASAPLVDVRTLAEIVNASLGQERLSLTLLLAFAGGALLLATLGLYGVVSNGVTRRTHEVGVRMALGAGRSTVMRMVLRQGLGLTLAGVALGLLGSLATSRVVGTVIVSADAGDPFVYASVVLALVALTSIAVWIPARRATRIDPASALRAE